MTARRDLPRLGRDNVDCVSGVGKVDVLRPLVCFKIIRLGGKGNHSAVWRDNWGADSRHSNDIVDGNCVRPANHVLQKKFVYINAVRELGTHPFVSGACGAVQTRPRGSAVEREAIAGCVSCAPKEALRRSPVALSYFLQVALRVAGRGAHRILTHLRACKTRLQHPAAWLVAIFAILLRRKRDVVRRSPPRFFVADCRAALMPPHAGHHGVTRGPRFPSKGC